VRAASRPHPNRDPQPARAVLRPARAFGLGLGDRPGLAVDPDGDGEPARSQRVNGAGDRVL
jgi:hypothetical protein